MNAGEAWKLRQKESAYRKLYSDLLQKHRGVLQEVPPPSPSSSSPDTNSSPNTSSSTITGTTTSTKDDYGDETQILNQIFRVEVGNLLVGVASTALTFGALRLAKTKMLTSSSPFSQWLLGRKNPTGNTTTTSSTETFHQAQMDARRYGTEPTQLRIAFFIEGLFSLWVGFRCYEYASYYNQSTATTTWQSVAEIPLCHGRSRVSDALCREWVDITNEQIPSQFWNEVVATGTVRDPQTWNVIRTFSTNCERRWKEEQRIRQLKGLDPSDPVSLPDRLTVNQSGS